MTVPEIVLVGELNPYGTDPRYAFYDLPVRASGYLLRTKVMRVRRTTYHRFKKYNLCAGVWSAPTARTASSKIIIEHMAGDGALFILLGKKVAEAFGGIEFFERKGHILCLPHPSGLNRMWMEPGAFDRAQRVLQEAAPHISWGESAQGGLQ